MFSFISANYGRNSSYFSKNSRNSAPCIILGDFEHWQEASELLLRASYSGERAIPASELNRRASYDFNASERELGFLNFQASERASEPKFCTLVVVVSDVFVVVCTVAVLVGKARFVVFGIEVVDSSRSAVDLFAKKAGPLSTVQSEATKSISMKNNKTLDLFQFDISFFNRTQFIS